MNLDFDSLSSNENKRGGQPCFPGTRIPAYILIDYLASGYSVDKFLEEYDVRRGKVINFLSEVRGALN